MNRTDSEVGKRFLSAGSCRARHRTCARQDSVRVEDIGGSALRRHRKLVQRHPLDFELISGQDPMPFLHGTGHHPVEGVLVGSLCRFDREHPSVLDPVGIETVDDVTPSQFAPVSLHRWHVAGNKRQTERQRGSRCFASVGC